MNTILTVQPHLDQYLAQENIYHLDSARKLNRIIRLIGYHSMEDFFDDNQGGIEAVIGWIGQQTCQEWIDMIEGELISNEYDYNEDADVEEESNKMIFSKKEFDDVISDAIGAFFQVVADKVFATSGDVVPHTIVAFESFVTPIVKEYIQYNSEYQVEE